MKTTLRQWLCFPLLAMLLSGCILFSSLTKEEEKALDDVMVILNTAITEAESDMYNELDPGSPLNFFVEELSEQREYVRQVETGKMPYISELISKLADQAQKIWANIRDPAKRVLETEIFFELGKYKISDLSEDQRNALMAFVRDIIEVLIERQTELLPDKIFVIMIRTTGYADATPPGLKTTSVLKTGIKEPLPREMSERRRLLNATLSRHRSLSVAEEIRTQLAATLEYPNIIISAPETLGLGEAFPYPEHRILPPPYKPKDQRRRVCKMQVWVAIKNSVKTQPDEE